jgi:hypothetical protein
VTTAISIGFIILKPRRSPDIKMLCFGSKDRVFPSYPTRWLIHALASIF